MSFRFRASESISTNVRRMARDRLDDAVEDLASAARGQDLHDNVHEARKRTKHVRALTRLVRVGAPELHDRVNDQVRDAARLLSDLRDGQAVVETLDDLADTAPGDDVAVAVTEVRGPLVADRDARARASGEVVADALARLRQVRDEVGEWDVPDDVEVVAEGVAKTYRRARRRMAAVRAEPGTEALHEWRKRVKYHRYHVRMLAPTWPAVLRVREDELHRLSDLLGDDHDLAVLRGVLEDRDDLAEDHRRILGARLDRRRAELQRAALPLGARLFAQDDDAMADVLTSAWEAWQEESGRDALPRPLTLVAATD